MQRLFKVRNARGITFVLITIAIVGSLMPPQQMEQLTFSLSDKLIHGLYYATLTFFWLLSTKTNTSQKYIQVGLSVFFFGLALEIMQDVLPIQREMDILDVFANTVGISIAIATARFLEIR
ncbi:MAG: VanZ family protein [Flavobacteriaceae bacterium]|nr:VanZ family protein [Flavobacteriaceae bacterium]